jgi:putative transposase
MNPVRAGMVVAPHDYKWTSYAANAAGLHDPLTQHPAYRVLGATAQERQLAYPRLFDDPPAADELDTIRTYLQRQHALGSTRFQMAIERQLARRVGPAKVGRPRKQASGRETAL